MSELGARVDDGAATTGTVTVASLLTSPERSPYAGRKPSTLGTPTPPHGRSPTRSPLPQPPHPSPPHTTTTGGDGGSAGRSTVITAARGPNTFPDDNNAETTTTTTPPSPNVQGHNTFPEDTPATATSSPTLETAKRDDGGEEEGEEEHPVDDSTSPSTSSLNEDNPSTHTKSLSQNLLTVQNLLKRYGRIEATTVPVQEEKEAPLPATPVRPEGVRCRGGVLLRLSSISRGCCVLSLSLSLSRSLSLSLSLSISLYLYR
jgi:hypothetical protein